MMMTMVMWNGGDDGRDDNDDAVIVEFVIDVGGGDAGHDGDDGRAAG